MICKEVLRVPFPSAEVPLPVDVLADHIHIVCCAKSFADILEGRVLVNRLRTKGRGHRGFSGFQPAILNELVSGPKNLWKENIENFASGIYPTWREHFQKTRRRLPDALRRDLKIRLVSAVEKLRFAETIVRWLGGSMEPAALDEMKKRLDAVLEFTTYVLREFLTRDYKLENHDSDVYDQFQLHYLAMDRFVLVSEDSDMATRTSGSTQIGRKSELFSVRRFAFTGFGNPFPEFWNLFGVSNYDLLYSGLRLPPHILAEFPMSEERKFAILIAATILSARKLAELENPDKPSPKKIATVETAIRHAAYILGEIDKKWPSKAPFAN